MRELVIVGLACFLFGYTLGRGKRKEVKRVVQQNAKLRQIVHRIVFQNPTSRN